MLRNLGTHRVLWLLTSLLSLVAALVGVLSPAIYSRVASPDILPAVIGQDLMTVVASVIILLLTILTRKDNSIKQIVILGILGYLFYAYGIYVIERFYNALYYLYLAIFGLSFWSMVYGMATIRRDILQEVNLSRLLRNLAAGFSFLIALIFTVLWVVQLLPLIQAGEKIEFLYSIYILDLCFIMPAFIIIGVMIIRNKGLAFLLAPAMFVLGFTLIFSLAVSELVKPFFLFPLDAGAMASSLVLSLSFLILAFFHLRNLKMPAEKA